MAYNIANIHIKSKFDYQQHKRKTITTSIREDLHADFEELCEKLKQPKTKGYDVLLMMLQDEEKLQEFVDKIQKY